MSVRTMAKVWEASKHAGSELLMLLAIADFADDDGRAYPSVPKLAIKCRMSPRNANMILAALRDSGELEIRHNEGPRGTNRYRVVTGLKASSPLKSASPLKPASCTPEAGFPKPLKPASGEPSLNHQEPSKKRERAKKKSSKRDTSSAKTTRIPDDWQPSEKLKAWALEKRPDLVDLAAVAENFRDHYIAKGEARASWDASFRTWVRKERAGGLNRQESLEASNRAVAARFLKKSRHTGFDATDYHEGLGTNGEILS
jgi:hypothetical protein